MKSQKDELKEEDCIFCKIVTKEAPCYKVWESQQYLAFLSIFPNTDGFTVVIPKYHLHSYIFDHPPEEINRLMDAAKQVSILLVSKFQTVARTALIFEGYGVNHLHAKLIPLHGTKDKNWGVNSTLPVSIKTKFLQYPGYVSSHDAIQESDNRLEKIANILTN